MLTARRALFCYSLAATMLGAARRKLLAEEADEYVGALPEGTELPPLPPDLAGSDNEPLPLPATLGNVPLFGTAAATDQEKDIGSAIIAGAPRNTTPIVVAQYFLDLGLGKRNQDFGGTDVSFYARAWPVRANPVIVEFFTATKTKPSGDTTPWCAAFLNWCILRSQDGRDGVDAFRRITHDASSGSFRSWGTAVDLGQGTKPQRGDVVVFVSTDSQEAHDGHGHVGFLLKEDPAHILLLGGNQFEQGRPPPHAVSVKRLAKQGAKLAFHSYRTDPLLHS